MAIDPKYSIKIMFNEYDSVEDDEDKMVEMTEYCVKRYGISTDRWEGCEHILGASMKNGQLGYVGIIFYFNNIEDQTEFKLRFL